MSEPRYYGPDHSHPDLERRLSAVEQKQSRQDERLQLVQETQAVQGALLAVARWIVPPLIAVAAILATVLR